MSSNLTPFESIDPEQAAVIRLMRKEAEDRLKLEKPGPTAPDIQHIQGRRWQQYMNAIQEQPAQFREDDPEHPDPMLLSWETLQMYANLLKKKKPSSKSE